MWQINEVVKFDESHYRILFFQSGEIIWINMEEAKGVNRTGFVGDFFI
ncbi:hypothetical protein MSG94_11720 [Acinetobacter baumannii]|nr:hypothetical protein [Acinetobacter baumannii]MDV4278968.1 hypothetical protein [Acinetobacter baumannii]